MAISVDLHLHTTASDGRLTPTELVDLTASKGLRTISVSDHDTTAGLEEAHRAVKRKPGMRLIPGIELSCDVPGGEVHMLGYFMDIEDAGFQGMLAEFREGRLGPRRGDGGETCRVRHAHRVGAGAGDSRRRFGRTTAHRPGSGRKGLLRRTVGRIPGIPGAQRQGLRGAVETDAAGRGGNCSTTWAVLPCSPIRGSSGAATSRSRNSH